MLRHTAAMMLLTAGVDTSTIALWLGHEQERTTHIYLHAVEDPCGRLTGMGAQFGVALSAAEPSP